MMLGFKPGLYFRACWLFLSPATLLVTTGGRGVGDRGPQAEHMSPLCGLGLVGPLWPRVEPVAGLRGGHEDPGLDPPSRPPASKAELSRAQPFIGKMGGTFPGPRASGLGPRCCAFLVLEQLKDKLCFRTGPSQALVLVSLELASPNLQRLQRWTILGSGTT